MKLPHPQKFNSGFSIIEVIVATVVISMMIIGVSNLMIAVGGIQRQSDNLAVANRLAEAKIESLRNNHYNTLVVGTINFTTELPPNLAEPRSAVVTISEPNPDIKRLDVNITYREGSRSKTVILTGLLGNIGISQ